MYVAAKCLHFVMSYMKQNKKRRQILDESALYGVEIGFHHTCLFYNGQGEACLNYTTDL